MFVDTGQVDKNMQVLHGVEGTWGLPALPDQVKLDIASLDGVDHHAVGQFATGLASDLKQATTPTPTPLQIPQAQPTPAPSYSVSEQFARGWAGINDKTAPTTLDDNGVATFKDRAKRLGFLDQSVPSDNTWNPALNQTRWQVMQHDSDQVFMGNHPGAVSVGGLSKFVGDWLTPSGLLKAAVKLDFLPDFNKTASDTHGFLHTLADVVDHPGLESFKNLFTKNPLVDLGVPVLNDVLLLTGVGEAWGMARAATLPLEGAELAASAEGLLGSSKLATAASFIRSSDYAQELQRFKEASQLSELVAKAGPVGEAVADKMQAWRQLESVALAKKGVQTGMRLGLAQKIEQAAGVDKGTDFGSIPGIEHYVNAVVTNPIVATIGEALFTPPNILEPGTYSRAAQAINPLRFLQVPQDQQLGISFLNGFRNSLETSDPAALQQLNDNVKKLGPAKGMAEQFLGGSTDQHLDDLGQGMTYVATAAAMDARAAAQADRLADRVGNPDRWQEVWSTFRNKYIAQLRTWDGMNDDQLVAHKAATLAADEGVGNASGVARNSTVTYKRLAKQAANDPEMIAKLQAEVLHHDDLARGFQAELLNEGIKPGVIEAYLPQVMDTFGDWSQFTNAHSNIIDALQSGVLDDSARYLTPTSERGARLVGVPGEIAAAKAAPASIPYHYQLFQNEDYIPWLSSRMYSVLARGIDPSVGAFSAAREDTPVKGELLQFLQSIRGRQNLLKDVGRVERSANDRQVFDVLGRTAQDAGLEGIHQIDNETAKDIITNLRSQQYGVPQAQELPGFEPLPGQGDGTRSTPTDRVLSWMRHAGYGDLPTMRQGLESDLRGLDASPLWAERYNIPSIVQTPDGLAPADLNAKTAALMQKSKWTAAQVELPPGMEMPEGYKLVHGVQYLLPSDLLTTAPIADLTENMVRRATLGAWFTKQNNSAFGQMVANTQRLNLSQRLSALSPDDLEGLNPKLGSADLNTVMDSVRGVLNDRQDAVQGILQQHGLNALKRGYIAAGTPQSITDLGDATNMMLLVNGLKDRGYTDTAARAVWQALKDSQAGSFKRYGLATLDKTIKNQPVLGTGLMTLGSSKAADGILGKTVAMAKSQVVPTAIGAALGGAVGGAQGALVGGAAGFAGNIAASKAIANHPDWLRYAYLGDQYEHLRDTARFGINPFFDVRRFVKSTLLAHTAELPADISLPAIPGKASFVKQFGEDAFNGYANEMRKAFRGTFDPNAIEDTHQFFTQVGMLGFNPTDWMTHMFGRLRMAGVDPSEAADTVKNVYAYGTKGRSAAEQSLNYVLFPFSFEKKVALTLGRYLSKDLSRTVMIHDALKTYSVLDDNYDLSDKLKQYVPLANELEKLNPMDHGLSLGELGGINAPLLRLFLPNVFPVGNGKESNALMEYGRRLLPFWGEVTHLKDDLAEQGHVLFSPNHMTTSNETDAGFAAMRDLRVQWEQELGAKHVSWNQMQSNPALQPLKSIYDQQAAEILTKYPAYATEREKLPEKSTKTQQEILVRLNDPTYRDRPENVALATFKGLTDQLDNMLQRGGYSWTDAPDLIPPAVFDAVHQDATELARSTPGFAALYKRFYANKYGTIERELV